ncbi:penicillin-binding protein 2 [Acetobacteraceae bacterium]|nr:penicillin-binding protein 2 [Acetobacteraceae bacterium]
MSRRRRSRFKISHRSFSLGFVKRYLKSKEVTTEYQREAVAGKIFGRRATLLLFAQMGVFATLSTKLYKIQVTDSEEFSEQALRNRLLRRYIVPPRGLVYDASGKHLLATNKLVVRAVMSSDGRIDVDDSIARFENLIAMDKKDYRRVVQERRRGGKNIPFTLKDSLTEEEIIRINQELPPIAGLSLDEGFDRIYPFGELTAHITGYVAVPNENDVRRNNVYALPGIKIGRGGLEEKEEDLLRGTPGNLENEVDARRDFIREISSTSPLPGNNLRLTLNLRYQEVLKRNIEDKVASAVLLNCQTGAVCAMVSSPSFDPSAFEDGISFKQWNAWLEDPATPLNNKAISGFYPPGSTFKPAVALAALQSKAISPKERIECPGYLDIGGGRFHCWLKSGHGALNVRQALKHSCDVFFYQAARRCGMEEIHKASEALGLCRPPTIELAHAGTGIVPNAEWALKHNHRWRVGDTINAGIGQGYVQTTPLGLAGYAASLATGVKISPYLVQDQLRCTGSACFESLPFDPAYLEIVRQGMWDVVNAYNGTAPRAKLHFQHIQMAGKTGTSQVRRVSRAMRESGKFNSMDLPWKYRPHALFIAYAPFDRPRYALSLVIEHGNASASQAAPLAGKIMEEILEMDPAVNDTVLTNNVA